MPQKGFVPIVFILGILIILTAILSYIFYLKSSIIKISKTSEIITPTQRNVNKKQTNQYWFAYLGKNHQHPLPYNLFIMSEDTTVDRQITKTDNITDVGEWSPDDRFILVYVAEPKPPQYGKKIYEYKGTWAYAQILDGEINLLDNFPKDAAPEHWLDDDKLVFSRGYDIFTYSISTKKEQLLLHGFDKTKEQHYFSYYLTPDRKLLVFNMIPSGLGEDMSDINVNTHVYNLENKTVKEFPLDAADTGVSGPERTGTISANISRVGGSRGEIYSISYTDSTNQKTTPIEIGNEGDVIQVDSISPDGRFIYYSKSTLNRSPYWFDTFTNKKDTFLYFMDGTYWSNKTENY